jgi:hypothetical protein
MVVLTQRSTHHVVEMAAALVKSKRRRRARVLRAMDYALYKPAGETALRNNKLYRAVGHTAATCVQYSVYVRGPFLHVRRCIRRRPRCAPTSAIAA